VCIKCNRRGVCSAPGTLGTCYCREQYAGPCCEQANPFTRIVATAYLVPQTLDFGAVAVGEVAAAQVLTFTPLNLVGFAIDAITVTGVAAADFTLGGTCAAGQPIPPGESCTVTVGFTPGGPGARVAQLAIAGTPSPGLSPVPLNGIGLAPAASIVSASSAPGRLYAGFDGAGVYYSADGGANWIAATTPPANLRVKALLIDPADSTRLYAATYGSGVSRSLDSGVNWSACGNADLANLNVLSLVIDGAGRMLAGTEAGVFLSTDACATWTAVNSGLP